MSNVRMFPRAHAERAPGRIDLRTLPETELAMAYVVHDDQRAFGELHRRLEPYLLAVARRRVRSPEVAMDLVQQAFLNAHLSRDRFELGSDFRPWITRILSNLTHDYLRMQRRRPMADLDPEMLASPAGHDLAERRDDASRARRALAQLKPRQRQVIEMHWLEERPFPEVAVALGERLSAVKVRAHRAYDELLRVLD